MKSKLIGAALFASLLVPFAAQADSDNKHKHHSHRTVEYVPEHVVYRHDAHERRKIDQRQQELHERIVKASRKGDLTRAETARLLREQAEIRQQERRYLADGRLSPQERARLHAELNQSSRHIHSQAHDSQQRW